MRISNQHTSRIPAALGIILAGLTSLPAMGAGCKTVNPGLIWTIQPMYVDNATPSAIYSDGANGANPSYVDGVDGVSAVINVCSGTQDATLNIANSKRRIGLNLSAKLASTSSSPTWTSIPDSQLFLNVRNLTYLPPGMTAADAFTFTTRVASNVTGPDRIYYNLRFQNPTSQAVTTAPGSLQNSPYEDALVVVEHIPASSTTPETWRVYPDPNSNSSGFKYVGTLLATIRNTTTNAGQFSVPFYFTITRK